MINERESTANAELRLAPLLAHLDRVDQIQKRKRTRDDVPVLVNGRVNLAFLDSGNNLPGIVFSENYFHSLGFGPSDLEVHPELDSVATAKKGASLTVVGVASRPLSLCFGGVTKVFRIRPIVVRNLSMPINIGIQFMTENNIDQLHSSQELRVDGRNIPLVDRKGPAMKSSSALAFVAKTVELPPNSVSFIDIKVPDLESFGLEPTVGLLESSFNFMEISDCHPTMGSITIPDDNGVVTASVINSQPYSIEIPEGVQFGTFTPDTNEKFGLNALANAAANPSESRAFSSAARKKFLETPERLAPKINKQYSTEWIKENFQLDKAEMLKQEPHLLREAIELIAEFSDIITDGNSYGKTHLIEHEIVTDPNVRPIKKKHRPLNPIMEKTLKKQLDEWTEQGVIEPSQSPWSFPLVPVAKKDGRVRWAIDYRDLNAITKKDSFPLPNIQDNLSRLAHSKFFSCLDSCGAFHAVKIKDQDKEKTAFSTPYGLYHFAYMPFGLSGAPGTFSRLVMKMLGHLPPTVALAYLDDTLVHSKTGKEHLTNLRKVFAAYRAAGVNITPKKTSLFRTSVEYLGHRVSAKGVHVVPAYVNIVKHWPAPTTIRELQSFLGKLQYYRRFIKGFSQVILPLTQYLTKENLKEPRRKFDLSPTALQAFESVKQELISAPILTFPDFESEEPFILSTDWSKTCIGATLSQKQNGHERVIAYGARKLNTAEQNYSPTKGELLAAVYFIGHFKYYLQHRRFILRTDHSALTWIRSMKHPTGMIARWLEILAHFDFEVKYRPGKLHGDADALSRIDHAPLLDMKEERITDEHFFIHSVSETKIAPDQMRILQQADPTLNTVKQWVESDARPDRETLRLASQDLRSYHSIFETLYVKDDCLYRKRDSVSTADNDRLCLPEQLQTEVINTVHRQSGHVGINSTLHNVFQRFYFPGAGKKIEMQISKCVPCQKKFGKPRDQKHTLVTTQVGNPFQKICVDLVGPFPASAAGNENLLTVKDSFTRWVEAYPLASTDAKSVARTLEKEYFSRFGFPLEIHCDNGTQFVAELMKEVCRLLNIKHAPGPTYNPKSNSVERSHRDLETVMKALVEDFPSEDWENLIYPALLALRTSRSRTTGFTPFFLLYGREAMLPIDIAYGATPDHRYGHVEYANMLYSRLERAFTIAREKMRRYIERTRTYYSDNVPTKLFEEGQLVWLYLPRVRPGMSRKLTSKWLGPFTVVSKVTPVLRKIRSVGNWNDTELESVVSIDRLKNYHSPDFQPDHPLLQLTSDELTIADEFVEVNSQNEPLGPRTVLPGGYTFVGDSVPERILDRDPAQVTAPSAVPQPDPSIPPEPIFSQTASKPSQTESSPPIEDEDEQNFEPSDVIAGPPRSEQPSFLEKTPRKIGFPQKASTPIRPPVRPSSVPTRPPTSPGSPVAKSPTLPPIEESPSSHPSGQDLDPPDDPMPLPAVRSPLLRPTVPPQPGPAKPTVTTRLRAKQAKQAASPTRSPHTKVTKRLLVQHQPDPTPIKDIKIAKEKRFPPRTKPPTKLPTAPPGPTSAVDPLEENVGRLPVAIEPSAAVPARTPEDVQEVVDRLIDREVKKQLTTAGDKRDRDLITSSSSSDEAEREVPARPRKGKKSASKFKKIVTRMAPLFGRKKKQEVVNRK